MNANTKLNVIGMVCLSAVIMGSFFLYSHTVDKKNIVGVSAESNYLSLCKSIPYPKGSEWNKESIDAFCDDSFTQTLSPESVYDLIQNGKGEVLDRLYDEIISGYFSGEVPEGTVLNAYRISFGGTSTQKRRLVKQWLKSSPGSAHAIAVRGMIFAKAASEERGGEFIGKTDKNQIKGMEELVKKALIDLEEAIRLNPKLIPAYRDLMFTTKLVGNKQLATEYYEKLKKIDPYNYYVLYAYATHFEPRWGGSLEKMKEIAEESQLWIDKNPRVKNLMAWSEGYPAVEGFIYKDYKKAVELFDLGYRHSPDIDLLKMASYSAAMESNHKKVIDISTQRLRFYPNDASVYVDRAKALTSLKNFEDAKLDLARAKIRSPNLTYIYETEVFMYMQEKNWKKAQEKLIVFINSNPNNSWALESSIWINLNYLNDEELGRKMVDKAISLYPESGVFNWLWWEFSRRTQSSDVELARKGFINNADVNDPRQREALKYAK
jgi:tetratricopeptide (TPR) repeat protein